VAPVVAFDVELMAVFALLQGMGLDELVPLCPLSHRDKAGPLTQGAGVLHVLKHGIAYKV
jgi:hypothetical protein